MGNHGFYQDLVLDRQLRKLEWDQKVEILKKQREAQWKQARLQAKAKRNAAVEARVASHLASVSANTRSAVRSRAAAKPRQLNFGSTNDLAKFRIRVDSPMHFNVAKMFNRIKPILPAIVE
jgi:hypothetical protein